MRAMQLALAAAGALWAVGCGGSEASDEAASPVTADGGATDAPIADGAPDVSTDAPTEEAAAPVTFTTCKDPPPPGATLPTLPTYAGTCPTLVQAPTENVIQSSGNDRKFLAAWPTDVQPNEKLPVVFLWHWLGGKGQDFLDKAQIETAVQQQRFIAIAPEAKGDLIWKWPFAVSDSDSRMQEELQFFDDMLACVAAQFPSVNAGCVASAGVSAGALFTSQLGPARADVLASILVLSGGVGGGFVRPWPQPDRALPALVLWGGSTDHCVVIDFPTTTASLEDALDKEGSFYVECQHNCGHSEPPFEAPPNETTYAAFWDFVYDHPFWTPAGHSPYQASGLPASFPSWCSTGGKGTSVPRTGECGSPGCPF